MRLIHAIKAAAVVTAIATAPVYAQDANQTRGLAATCTACHGTDGIGITPQYPTLAGQHADYLERALTHYKKGGRQNAIMSGFAGQLSARDIKSIAAYYAAQRPSLDAVKPPTRR